MKSNFTKLSLALLSTALLLGCQDQGSGPVGPDGLEPLFAKGGNPGKPDKPGGSGGTGQVDVTVSGGMTTASQTMGLSEKRGLVRLISSNPVTIPFNVAMTETHAAGIGACTQSGADNPDEAQAVFDILVGGVAGDEQVFVKIDTGALGSTSEDHGFLLSSWLKVKGSQGSPSPTRADVSGDFTGDFTVTFSGGTIEVNSRTGKNKDRVFLYCPIAAGDAVTFSVVAPS